MPWYNTCALCSINIYNLLFCRLLLIILSISLEIPAEWRRWRTRSRPFHPQMLNLFIGKALQIENYQMFRFVLHSVLCRCVWSIFSNAEFESKPLKIKLVLPQVHSLVFSRKRCLDFAFSRKHFLDFAVLVWLVSLVILMLVHVGKKI